MTTPRAILSATTPRPFASAGFASALAFAGAVAAFLWFLGSSNPFTPAGYVGYLTKGAILGKSRFYGVQRGPTSAGRTWLLDVTNVSITPYTYSEDFTGNDAVLSRDNLKIAFRVHTVWRVDEARVPLFMERYSTTASRRPALMPPALMLSDASRAPARPMLRHDRAASAATRHGRD